MDLIFEKNSRLSFLIGHDIIVSTHVLTMNYREQKIYILEETIIDQTQGRGERLRDPTTRLFLHSHINPTLILETGDLPSDNWLYDMF